MHSTISSLDSFLPPVDGSIRGNRYDTPRYAYRRRLDLHQVRVANRIRGGREGLCVLEVGCATGELLNEVFRGNCQTTGLDVNGFALEKVPLGIKTVEADADDGLPFGHAEFDVAIALHVLEHVKNPAFVFSELNRVLRPGGVAFVAVPAEPFRGAFAVVSSMRLHRHPFRAREIHSHRLRRRTLSDLAAKHGFVNVWVRLSWRPLPQFFLVATKS
jgi:SAM-dependent methyltransferase